MCGTRSPWTTDMKAAFDATMTHCTPLPPGCITVGDVMIFHICEYHLSRAENSHENSCHRLHSRIMSALFFKGPRHARSTHIGESGRIARHRSLAGCHAGCPEAHIWYVRTRPVEERVSSLSSTASSRASLGISHLLRLCAASVQLFLSALPAAARAG